MQASVCVSVARTEKAGPRLVLFLSLLLLLQLAAAGVISECSEGSCPDCLDAATSHEIEALIKTHPVVLVAIPNMRCTIAALAKLEQCGVTPTIEYFTPVDISSSWSNFQTTDAKWRYMDCRYHTEQGGMTMHSWMFVEGQLLGDGFDIIQRPCSDLAGSVGSSDPHDGLR